jgi:serine/threonine-protein kinase
VGDKRCGTPVPASLRRIDFRGFFKIMGRQTHPGHRDVVVALSKPQLETLARLVDVALALPPAARETWISTLGPEHGALLPRLRVALGQADDAPTAGYLNLPSLPLPEDDAQPGQTLGPYRLVRQIGRGGMGSIWLAERIDGLFQRQVALKLPRLARGADLVRRMAGEREIGARLEHPRIARLYDAGVDERGRPYLVMEWVRGLHLGQYADHHRLTVRQRLALMLQVCDAVSHAHRHLVVHRDLKPGNILVDGEGDVKLLDFGVAQLLDDAGHATAGEAGVARLTHTPHYAAPNSSRAGRSAP